MENNMIKNVINGTVIYRDFDGKALAILPCKCGSIPIVERTDEYVQIACPNCPQIVVRKKLNDAVEEWNRRNNL